MLSRKRNAGMGASVATVFWLAPVTGFTLAFVRIAVDGWGNVFSAFAGDAREDCADAWFNQCWAVWPLRWSSANIVNSTLTSFVTSLKYLNCYLVLSSAQGWFLCRVFLISSKRSRRFLSLLGCLARSLHHRTFSVGEPRLLVCLITPHALPQSTNNDSDGLYTGIGTTNTRKSFTPQCC